MTEFISQRHEDIEARARNVFAQLLLPGKNRGDTGRGLYISQERAFPEPYGATLPKFNGRDIQAIINDAVNKNSHNTPAVLVDVGYGAGYYLLDVATTPDWRNYVSCIGYGPDNDTFIPYYQLDLPSTSNALRDAGVRLINGNIIDIDSTLLVQPDVLTVSHVIGWVEYPHWELLKKIYQVTAVGGIGLINSCAFQVENSAIHLETLLRRYGYEFEIDRKTPGDIAFCKTHEFLDLPIIDVWQRDGVAGIELQ